MKRADIKRHPLADITLAGLKLESKEYRELNGNGLYFRVKPDGGKSWQLRDKRPAGNCAWMGLGGYPEVSDALARDKAADLRKVVSSCADPLEQKRSAKAAIDAAKTRILGALQVELDTIETQILSDRQRGDEAKAAALGAVGFALDEEWNAATERLVAVGAQILAVSYQKGGMGDALSGLEVPRFGPFHSRLDRADLAAVARNISLEELLAA